MIVLYVNAAVLGDVLLLYRYVYCVCAALGAIVCVFDTP